MNDKERQLIETLVAHLQNAPAPQIDREADDLIRRTIGSRPDALYVLTQTAILQQLALEHAQQQIDELRAQQQEQPAPSFLGGLFSGSSAPRYPQQQPMSQPQYAPPSSGVFSGFLRNAAQTAAGIMAGEMAFSALSSLFGGHSYYGGGSGFLGGGGETVVNNYYEDEPRHHLAGGGDDPSIPDNLSAGLDDAGSFDDSAALDDGSGFDDGSGSTDV